MEAACLLSSHFWLALRRSGTPGGRGVVDVEALRLAQLGLRLLLLRQRAAGTRGRGFPGRRMPELARVVGIAWKGPGDPSTGEFPLIGDSSLGLQLLILRGISPYWRTRMWNGVIVPACTKAISAPLPDDCRQCGRDPADVHNFRQLTKDALDAGLHGNGEVPGLEQQLVVLDCLC